MPDTPQAKQATTEAQRLLELAAIQAASVGAPRNAIALYDRLLDLSPPDDTLIRVTLSRAEIAPQLGIGLASSLARLTTAVELAERLGRLDELLALRLASATVEVLPVRPPRLGKRWSTSSRPVSDGPRGCTSWPSAPGPSACARRVSETRYSRVRPPR